MENVCVCTYTTYTILLYYNYSSSWDVLDGYLSAQCCSIWWANSRNDLKSPSDVLGHTSVLSLWLNLSGRSNMKQHLQQVRKQLGASKVGRVGSAVASFYPWRDELRWKQRPHWQILSPKHDTWKSRCDARVGVRLLARFAGRPAGRASVCVARLTGRPAGSALICVSAVLWEVRAAAA